MVILHLRYHGYDTIEESLMKTIQYLRIEVSNIDRTCFHAMPVTKCYIYIYIYIYTYIHIYIYIHIRWDPLTRGKFIPSACDVGHIPTQETHNMLVQKLIARAHDHGHTFFGGQRVVRVR